MDNLKYSVWAIWIGGGAAILFGSGWVATAGHVTVWLTLLAHAVEFAVNRSLFERAGGSMAHHFVQTLIYGLFHWSPIKQRLAHEQPEGSGR
jgi:uncharacterized protein YhhL (DUF1145 family)